MLGEPVGGGFVLLLLLGGFQVLLFYVTMIADIAYKFFGGVYCLKN